MAKDQSHPEDNTSCLNYPDVLDLRDSNHPPIPFHPRKLFSMKRRQKPHILRHLSATFAATLISSLMIVPQASADRRTPQEDDVSLAASALGISEKNVKAYIDGQGNFAQLVAVIQRRLPQHFVHAQWDGPNSPTTAIHVRPGGIRQAQKIAPKTPIRASSALSEVDRVKAEQDLIAQAVEKTGGQWHIGADVNPLTNSAEIRIETPSLRARTASISKEDFKNPYGIRQIRVSDSSPKSGVEYGSGGNWGNCTAGFTALHYGKPAITSTSHCGKIAKYDGATVGGRSAVNAKGGDVQTFLLTGGKLTNSLRYDWGKHRPIKKVWDPSPGNIVCHFGIATGHSCATVKAVNKTEYFPKIGTVGKLVFVDRHNSAGGDSGGPWFWSDRAHGIHMGRCGSVSCFTQITAFNSIGTAIYKG